MPVQTRSPITAYYNTTGSLSLKFLDNPRAWHGDISGPETWWVARHAFDSEDGQSHSLRVCMDATRISGGRPVMLKRLPIEEGPYEPQINKLFSTEPLSSDPRNRCAQLLDAIQLPNEEPIMVHSLLRPFGNPPSNV